MPISYWPVEEKRAFSDGDFQHARYLVKNHMSGLGSGADMHSENPGNVWYSEEGLEAAKASDVIPPSPSSFDDDQAIDLWMSGPFHALPILDPELRAEAERRLRTVEILLAAG